VPRGLYQETLWALCWEHALAQAQKAETQVNSENRTHHKEILATQSTQPLRCSLTQSQIVTFLSLVKHMSIALWHLLE